MNMLTCVHNVVHYEAKQLLDSLPEHTMVDTYDVRYVTNRQTNQRSNRRDVRTPRTYVRT